MDESNETVAILSVKYHDVVLTMFPDNQRDVMWLTDCGFMMYGDQFKDDEEARYYIQEATHRIRNYTSSRCNHKCPKCCK